MEFIIGFIDKVPYDTLKKTSLVDCFHNSTLGDLLEQFKISETFILHKENIIENYMTTRYFYLEGKRFILKVHSRAPILHNFLTFCEKNKLMDIKQIEQYQLLYYLNKEDENEY